MQYNEISFVLTSNDWKRHSNKRIWFNISLKERLQLCFMENWRLVLWFKYITLRIERKGQARGLSNTPSVPALTKFNIKNGW
jgi:hypothetical protein